MSTRLPLNRKLPPTGQIVACVCTFLRDCYTSGALVDKDLDDFHCPERALEKCALRAKYANSMQIIELNGLILCLKNLSTGSHWKEVAKTIDAIRLAEKMRDEARIETGTLDGYDFPCFIEWQTAWKRGDLEHLLSFFTDDAEYNIPDHADAIIGKSNLRAFLHRRLQTYQTSVGECKIGVELGGWGAMCRWTRAPIACPHSSEAIGLSSTGLFILLCDRIPHGAGKNCSWIRCCNEVDVEIEDRATQWQYQHCAGQYKRQD